MRVRSFYPVGLNDQQRMHVFASEFAEASNHAALGLANGSFTKFIIDVHGNGGGYLDLAYFTSYCLTGDSASPLSTPGHIRHNSGFDQIAYICAACTWESTSTACEKCKAHRIGQLLMYDMWGPQNSSTHFTNGTQFYCPAAGTLAAGCVGQGYIRDGSTCTQMSHRIFSQYDSHTPGASVDMSVPAAACPKSFAKNNTQLYILSDGLCGSTCSVFARRMQRGNYAKTIAVGGMLDTPMAVASFGGGQVWSSPITADLSRGFEAIRAAAGVAATAEVPDGFPASFPSTGSGFTFVPQETGGSDAACGIPAEFVFQPADIRLYFTAGSFGLEGRVGGLRALYREAITKIDHCADKDCDNCAGRTSAVTGCGADPSVDTCTTTAAPTVMPTTAPTGQHNAAFSANLYGIALSDFDATAKASFMSVVATNAGTHCGPHGTSICSALAVTVRAFARRDISVSFQLNVNSASAIRLARSTLSTYLVSSQFVTDLNNEGGGLAGVTSVTITSGLMITKSDDENFMMLIILLCVGTVALILPCGLAGYLYGYALDNRSSTQPQTTQGDPAPVTTVNEPPVGAVDPDGREEHEQEHDQDLHEHVQEQNQEHVQVARG